MTPLDTFRTLLSDAITKHYTKVNSELDNLYGYCLYTEDTLSNIVCAYNTETDISVSTSDDMYDYYRYGAPEWQHFEDYGMFDEVNRLLAKIMDCYDDIEGDQNESWIDQNDIWVEQRQKVLDACLEELVSLDSSGLFGSQDSGRFVVICLSDSGNPIMDRSAKELNNQEVYKAYSEKFTC